MRKLNNSDMIKIAENTVHGYQIEGVRIKRGLLSNMDNYGIILGKNPQGHHIT